MLNHCVAERERERERERESFVTLKSDFFSKTSNYSGLFVPFIHPADYLFTACTNVAGQIVSDSFRQSKYNG
jgi:hypothetical protein